MRRKHGNEFTNGGFNKFQKQTGNILNHVETFATFDALDNVLSGYSPGCDAPSVGAPLASCYCLINRTEDAQLYLDVYRKYARVSGKVPCVQQGTGLRGSSAFVGGVGDGLDKRKLQTSGNSDVFEAYLALCSSGAGSRRSRSLSQTTPVSNSNWLQPTVISSVCGPSASLPGRSFHAYPNAVMITADSQHSYPVSRDGGNTQENCQLRSTIGVNNNGSSASRRDRNLQVRPCMNSAVGMRSTSRRTGRRVLTSGSTVDSNSVASAGTSYTYSDLGDCDRCCRYCGASFWYVERLKRHSHNQTPEYHLCCGGGRIQMHPPREPPEYINILFQNKHFMENIHGQRLTSLSTLGEGHMSLKSLNTTTALQKLDIPEFKIRLYNAEGARGYELSTSNTLGAMVLKMFPLLFIYGQPGYHTELTLKSANGVGRGKRPTMLAYYRYQLHFKLQQYDLLFRGGRLFQQYVVGVFCAVEQKRLDYIRKKQNDIRSDYLSGLRSSKPVCHVFIDALAIFRKLGNPQFFIIFTCNVNWPKIKRFMSKYPHLTASDRAYVVCRVFEQKIQALIAFLKEERIFGDVTGVLYTSELPDPRIDPEGYNVVSEMMVYGPCIAASVKAPCMKGDKCSKKFPKKFNQKTFFDENGHVHYQRRDTSVSTTRNEFQLDNSYVVPYNRNLLLAFQTHINVEYCGWSMLIKYMFKYISKGTDRVFTRMSRPIGESSTVATPSRQVIDEIQNYVEGRFICAHEAYRRILKFDIHRREPTVHILAMHLEDMQRITFRDQDRLKSVIDLPRKKSTTLIEWFAFNEANEVVKSHISYLEFPSEFVWYSDRKSWSSRKTSKSSIGRLAAACQALSLLGDDKEWDIAFEDACGSATPEAGSFFFFFPIITSFSCDIVVQYPSRLLEKD
ncbi:DNA helicase [Tanacetum coccineum]